MIRNVRTTVVAIYPSWLVLQDMCTSLLETGIAKRTIAVTKAGQLAKHHWQPRTKCSRTLITGTANS